MKDTILTTYSSNKTGCEFSKLFPSSPDAKNIRKDFPELEKLLEKTIKHEFDLLGSGWTKVYYGMDAKGISGVKYDNPPAIFPEQIKYEWINHLINKSNRQNSKKIWQHISGNYNPVDWHIDFKSGFRWDPKTWWFRIPYGHKPGVDIKVPWEITRSQHMPWLALGYGMYLNEQNNEHANNLAIEFQNQLIDFIATNPPKYGVNWRCPMDVAIRAANWILTYELFRNYGWEPCTETKKIFANSLHDHGKFIFDNLEIGKDGFRGNHYLADVCGLAFISGFLPNSYHQDEWIKFSHKALVEEMDYQFYDDGANFEGSTAYHRLSAEMMLYTTLMFDNLPKTKRKLLPPQLFSSKFYQKLYNMKQFSECITRPDHVICQIGDNDSGRFFKIQPDFIMGEIQENHLSQKNLSSCLNAFFKKDKNCLNSKWIFGISTFNSQISPSPLPTELNKLENFKGRLPEIILEYLTKIQKSRELHLLDGKYIETTHILPFNQNNSQVFIYENFGMYTWKNANSFMTFRCGPVGQKERGGHDHNDQLSIELITPELKIEDPGTAIYTPFPEIRNKYRSAASHFAPQVFKKDGIQIEPGDLSQGLFSLKSDQGSEIIFASNRALAGFNKSISTIRIILIQDQNIIVKDICLNSKWKIETKNFNNQISYSKGYGLY